jgi:hypothetical protein
MTGAELLAELRRELEHGTEPSRFPVAVLICGLPGLGKSTLARALRGHAGAGLVSVDEISSRAGDSLNAYRTACKLVSFAWRVRRNVVIDACALSAEYRAHLLEGWGGRRVVVWLRPDLRLVRERRPWIPDLGRWHALCRTPTMEEGWNELHVIEALRDAKT